MATVVYPKSDFKPYLNLAVFTLVYAVLMKLIPAPITTVNDCSSTPGFGKMNGYAVILALFFISAFFVLNYIISPYIKGKISVYSFLGITLLPLLANAIWFFILFSSMVEAYLKSIGIWSICYSYDCYGDTTIGNGWIHCFAPAVLYFIIISGLFKWLKK